MWNIFISISVAFLHKISRTLSGTYSHEKNPQKMGKSPIAISFFRTWTEEPGGLQSAAAAAAKSLQ